MPKYSQAELAEMLHSGVYAHGIISVHAYKSGKKAGLLYAKRRVRRARRERTIEERSRIRRTKADYAQGTDLAKRRGEKAAETRRLRAVPRLTKTEKALARAREFELGLP